MPKGDHTKFILLGNDNATRTNYPFGQETLRIKIATRVALVLVAATLVAACMTVEPYTPAFTDVVGTAAEGTIYSIETVMLGGIEQTITIRGTDRKNPVLRHLHGGPGMPSSPWASW